MRWIPTVLAAMLVLELGLVGACSDRDLQKIEVPSGGVSLGYDLTPGATYKGHLRVGNSRRIEGLEGPVNQNLECDVKLIVLGEDKQRGGTLIQATFTDVDLDWALPPNVPISADEFLKQAISLMQGMKVLFNVLPSGKITFMPPPPQAAEDEIKFLITNVTDALAAAFLEVPERPLKQGESWEEDQTRGREGKLGRYREGKITTVFDGMFRHKEREEDLAKLTIKLGYKDVITTKEGRRTNESEGKTTAFFSTDGYLAELDAETREFDPKQGMTFTKIRAEWRKTGGGAPPPEPGEVQEITDPCDPDYVGPQECKETPPEDKPPEDKPPEDKPPPEDEPAADKPAADEPGDEKPDDKKPPEDAVKKPADEKPDAKAEKKPGAEAEKPEK